MAKVLSVTATDAGLIFIDPKDNKVVERADFEKADEPQAAIKALRAEVNARGNATRAALSLLVNVLDSTRMNGYKAMVKQNERIPAPIKSAMREAEDIYLKPLLVDSLPKSHSDQQKLEAWDAWINELRQPGIYARVRGVCLKYFTVHGRLPCAYDAEHNPHKEKLLPVSAMEKLMQNEAARNPPATPDHSIPSEIGRLIARMAEEKEKLSIETMQLIIDRCASFAQEAKELMNLRNQAMTEALHGLKPQEPAPAKELLTTPTKPAEKAPAPAPVAAKGKQQQSAHA